MLQTHLIHRVSRAATALAVSFALLAAPVVHAATDTNAAMTTETADGTATAVVTTNANAPTTVTHDDGLTLGVAIGTFWHLVWIKVWPFASDILGRAWTLAKQSSGFFGSVSKGVGTSLNVNANINASDVVKSGIQAGVGAAVNAAVQNATNTH